MPLTDLPHKSLIDCHVHLAALPERHNGCLISSAMLKSPLFRFLLWKHQLSPKDPGAANRKYIQDLLGELRASRHVGQAVLLGMDGVYTNDGRINHQATEFLISNDYVLQQAQAYPNEFLAGVSINPQRIDAIEELHRCAEAGAVLVKVLPNSQQFDPGHHRYQNFYRELAKLGLPLLSHVGYEFSLMGKDQSVGDPNRLRTALDAGATVIAAHACSYGLMMYEKFYPTLLEFVNHYPNFYADISALTLPNRMGMMLKLRHHPEIFDRLIFGTDYPLSVFHLPLWGLADLSDIYRTIRTRNRFDRQYLVCQHLDLGFVSLETLLKSSSPQPAPTPLLSSHA
ncbi:MAG: amidohydrolase family protein [Nitrospirota bacterium]|nr:amidohydrolase family protein [Nitrospirota bacterium]MDH5773738.1 amidohydrolase family protein [Nitrospirota bacterium]